MDDHLTVYRQKACHPKACRHDRACYRHDPWSDARPRAWQPRGLQRSGHPVTIRAWERHPKAYRRTDAKRVQDVGLRPPYHPLAEAFSA